MMERIADHGQKLIEFFTLDPDTNPVTLCKKLRRLEIKSNAMMVDYCNGDLDGDEIESYCLDDLRPKLEKILGPGNMEHIYINRDPRGYTLKINEIASTRASFHKDWGGYSIIAPDLRESP